MSLSPSRILDCKIGDLIEYDSPITNYEVIAVITGEAYRRNHERWIIQPLGDTRRKPYMIKKTATVWKKLHSKGDHDG